MKDNFNLSKYIKSVFQTPSTDASEWFGYYNYDTLNSDHSRMICTRVFEDGVFPRAELKVEIGFYDVKTGDWHHVGMSDSWNWQQGPMAQWLNDDEIIYNTSDGSKHIAVIHNILRNEDRVIDWAIYGITPDGRKSIALDMERAHWVRAYHYQSVQDKSKDGRIFDVDGIFEIDLVNNTRKKIISIDDILALDERLYFKNAKHWLEHVMINQTGDKFCFLHRFSSVSNVYSYKTRLIIVDMKTLDMFCVSGWETVQWSHFGWNKENFAIYSYPTRQAVNEKDFEAQDTVVTLPPQLVKNRSISVLSIAKYIARNVLPKRLQLRLKGGITCYQYYKKEIDNSYVLSDCFDQTPFLTDGHPSFTPDGRYMITDTYPDKHHLQRLYVYDMVTRKHLLLGTFYAYYDHNPASCDLHPKLSRDGQFVVVDSAHDSKHHMLVFQLDWGSIKNIIS
ncbi:hypothetical protein [uncultured Bacteroides sp.]|uniref:hypothetical protein n=1 Tax=uncultured Bacteroides sp. TaxID=162156 RepID=UPI002AAAA956|nr:hypothetical protein [uncultured Bacteroides sp.]